MKMKFNIFKKKKNKESTGGGAREVIAKLSRGLMLPIAMLPIAGLFLGIGSAIATNCPSGSFGNIFGMVIKAPGQVIFDNLAVLFAVAIAITFTGDIGVAGLSSFVGWIVFCALQSAFIITKTHVNDDGVVVTDWYRFLFYTFEGSKGITMFNSIFTSNVGIKSLCTSVFGGLTVGFTVAMLYNKFKNIQLPQIIGFFSGIRFIPIVTFMTMIPLSILFSLVWPAVGLGLFCFGQALGSLSGYGGINAFLNDFISRSLGPFGLHHAFYTPLWYTAVGGQVDLTANFIFDGHAYISLDGVSYANYTWTQLCTLLGYNIPSTTTSIQGDQQIWMFFQNIAGKQIWVADSASPAAGTASLVRLTFDNLSLKTGLKGVFAGQYMSGRYSIMMFALPAAAAAMVLTIPKGENRKVASSIILSAALTSFLTGITEPLEFTFLFLAPWLYWGFHAVMCGFSAMFMVILHAHMGMTFSGGVIDFFIYGVLPDISKMGANCYWVIVVGLVLAVAYFFMFYWAIKHFDIKTPGRDPNAGVIKMYTKKDYLARKDGQSVESDPMVVLAAQLIKAYGGQENIKNVDACITKLRIQVADRSKTNKQKILDLGARGVVYPSNQSVYAIFGTQADILKNIIKDIISGKIKAPVVNENAPVAATKVENNNLNKQSTGEVIVCAPANGEIVSTKKVKDSTFSENIMGKGFAIIPTDGSFVAPITGKVTLVNNHAYAIEANNGVQVLVHIGIDTVKIANQKPFNHLVKVGAQVKAGQKVVEANLDLIKKNKLDTITPVIVLSESINNRKLSETIFGKTNSGKQILIVK